MKTETHYQIISKVIAYIIKHKLEGESLEQISSCLDMSPGYLQKVFTKWVGISPKQFSRYLTLAYSKQLLLKNKNTLDTAVSSGLSSPGRLYDVFVDIEAITPGEYQKQGTGMDIMYSVFETKFGMCLVASTNRGVCNILFFDKKVDGIKDLRSRWKNAHLKEVKIDAKDAPIFHKQIENYFKGLTQKSKIKFHLKGTNFQIKVWEALLTIPEGQTATYGDIAQILGDKKLSRAAGTAIGDNPIGYIIPCHRVLKSTGEISGYHWGVKRKQTMLCYEAIRKENNKTK